jgi:hypothetical protein
MAAAAAMAAALLISNATANSLSVSNSTIRAVWTPLTFSNGGIEVRCDLTLEGSFHESTFSKVQDALIGTITGASFDGNNCSPEEGTFSVLTGTLPWPIAFEGYSGELPNITGIEVRLLKFEFLEELFGFVGCLFGTGPSQEYPAGGILNLDSGSGVVTGLRADETVNIPLQEELDVFGLCSSEMGFSGTGTVSVLGSEEALTVRLIS